MSQRNLLIVDDQVLFAKGLQSLIEELPEAKVCDILPNGQNIESVLFNKNIDVLLLDLNLPGKSGIEILSDIRDKYPDLIIIILTMYADEELAKLTKRKGANAYLSKNASIKELEHVIFYTKPHDFYLGKHIQIKKNITTLKEDKFNKFALITSREKEIIKLIVSGKTSIKIADELNISSSTVQTHRRNIFRKLDVNKVSELISKAHEYKVI